MFLGLFSQSSGVERLLNILLVSVSISACFVSLSMSFSSRFMPMVLGVRVILKTIGGGADLFLVLLLFCFLSTFWISSALLAGLKYCCMSLVVCARLQSWQ